VLPGSGFVRRVLDLGICLLVALFAASDHATAAIFKIDPNSMLVEGIHNNTHVVTPNMQFKWTFPGPGTQTNWQIQVDSDPNFNGHLGEIWFWDSGSGSKAGMEALTDVKLAVISAPTLFPRPIDTRADQIYWRLRVQVNNDPNWNLDPNYFSTGYFKLNQITLPSDDLDAITDAAPGIVPAFTFPVLNPAPREFFVSPSGNDVNAGTLALPFKTISKGITVLTPGDTLSLRAGVYNENVHVTTNTIGVLNGTEGNPITIRNRPGEVAIVRAVTAGPSPFAAFSFQGSSTSLQHWVLDGVKIGGTGAAVGVQLNFADSITLRNLSFESTFNPNATGIQFTSAGRGNRILNSKFDTPMFDMIENQSCRHLEIRGNEFKNQNGHVAIHWHNSGTTSGIIEGNSFHDLVTSEGAIFAYLAADGMVIRDNLFYNVTERPGGYAAGILPLRCGKIIIENNTFVNNKRGIGVSEFTRFMIVRNNIFFNTGTAIDFRQLQDAQPGSATVGMVLSHNFFFNNAKNVDFFYPQDANDITVIANCPADPNVINNAACDPKLVDPNNSNTPDLHLTSASPARDAGDPNVPIPVGGGSAPDIGALEFGAAAMPPYDFQSFVSVSDPTPRFTWSLVDRDNDLHALFPTIFTDNDSQAGFQLQIDTRNTFDSVNGDRPLFDTGTVLSAVSGYTVPDVNTLPAGDFYMRVRLRDENQALPGAWSNNDFRISVAIEPAPPVLTLQNPAPGAFAVSATASITTHVVDTGTGVNQGSIVMHIGINNANAPTLVTPQITQVGSSGTDFLLTFTPGANQFGSGDVITVRVEADDKFTVPGPPNHMDVKYSFTIKDLVPPAKPLNLRIVP